MKQIVYVMILVSILIAIVMMIYKNGGDGGGGDNCPFSSYSAPTGNMCSVKPDNLSMFTN